MHCRQVQANTTHTSKVEEVGVLMELVEHSAGSVFNI